MRRNTVYAPKGLKKGGVLVEDVKVFLRGHPPAAEGEEGEKRLQQRSRLREATNAPKGLTMHGDIAEIEEKVSGQRFLQQQQGREAGAGPPPTVATP